MQSVLISFSMPVYPGAFPRRPSRPRGAIVLTVTDQNRAAAVIEIGFGQRQRLVDPQTGAPEHHDQGV
jgi:hypothetical protein